MTRKSRGYFLLVFYMSGFLIGILYANLVGETCITTTGIFHEQFLNHYTNQEIYWESYLFYLIQKRIGVLLFLILGGMTKLRKYVVYGFLLWTGFASGVLAVASVLRLGVAGMLFYFAALFPQGLFYLFGYMILLLYLAGDTRQKWNLWKTVFLVLSVMAGIFTEAFVNPEIVRMILKIFH